MLPREAWFSLTSPLGLFFCCAQDEGLSLNITSPGPRCMLPSHGDAQGIAPPMVLPRCQCPPILFHPPCTLDFPAS